MKYPSVLLILLALCPTLASAKIVISELDLENSRVELVNIGTEMVDLTGYRWCNRFNGSPAYSTVSVGTINEAFSSDLNLEVEPGEIMTFDLTATFLPVAGGELGIYLPAGSYNARSAIIDYVNWGTSTGVRDVAAVGEPAIWVLDTAIDVTTSGAGDTIQLKLKAPGDVVEDYVIAPNSIGIAQSVEVPEENTTRITKQGFIDGGTFFIEFEFSGNGAMKLTESADLQRFTEVATRTKVTSPSPNRREFALPFGVERLFFRVEQELAVND